MCRKFAYIISLNFNPGHVSHMVASYKQCEEMGYEVWMYIDRGFVGFIPKGCQYIIYGKDKPVDSALSVFVFPSVRNLKEIIWLKRNTSSKIIYIFHEPLDKYSTYRKAGFSHQKMLKLRVINMVNALTVKWSDIILLPSNKAVSYYKSNKLYKNENYCYIPLLYDDEQTEELKHAERQYFSYIGTVASDHSFDEYVDFVRQVIQKDELKGFKFLIGTKSKVDHKGLSPLIESGRLELYEGKPLTDSLINCFYASSYAVWNAYERTTQSGVLAKAFMFGTPVVFLEKNSSEFVYDGKEGIAIKTNTDYDAIKEALKEIKDHFTYYSEMCRNRFLQSFYYRNYNCLMEGLLQKQLEMR